jgi:molecular chaperone GrpE
MTSARRPAGAADEERRPAGAPDQVGETDAERSGGAFSPDAGNEAPGETQGSDDESAAAVDADLDALLEDVRRERDEYLEIARRARADFENYRKRAARDARDAERQGKAGLARELVPALDNLERALRSAGVDPEALTSSGEAAEAPSEEVSAHEALARGVALVYRELRGTLERAGVETYDPTGERFDPTQHEALAVRTAEDGVDPGVVIETLDKGYRLDGQVLRAARVVVSE